MGHQKEVRREVSACHSPWLRSQQGGRQAAISINADNQVLVFIPDDSESNISCIYFPFALCNSVTLKLGCASESPGRLVKTQIAGRQLHGFCLVSLGVRGWAPPAFPASARVTGILLAQGITCLTCSFSKYGPQTIRSESPRNLAETQVCGLTQFPSGVKWTSHPRSPPPPPPKHLPTPSCQF